jgi:hypothetical protein
MSKKYSAGGSFKPLCGLSGGSTADEVFLSSLSRFRAHELIASSPFPTLDFAKGAKFENGPYVPLGIIGKNTRTGNPPHLRKSSTEQTNLVEIHR